MAKTRGHLNLNQQCQN